MTDEDNNKYLGKILNASELLKNRGIKCITWEEWEKASSSLPKLGQKQYEPNNTWLENNAVQNGINIRKDLLNLEKVNRMSSLATAEWLPHKKKAKVTKKSGKDWSSFGREINSELYLIPEEAMLLLEMNNLELYWNGVSLSVQQAYEILFDNTDYTLDHYRVYRQLVKEGYNLQRYVKKQINEPRHSVGKKVIVEPENGLRMNKASLKLVDVEKEDVFENQSEKTVSREKTVNSEISKNANSSESDKVNKKTENSDTTLAEQCAPMEVDEDPTDERKNDEHCNNDDKKKKARVEIISDEIVLDSIKIPSSASKWPGSRIQRNVKLMPKRNHLNVPANNAESKDITVINSGEDNVKRGEKRILQSDNKESKSKKLREEVIDISDDEDKDVQRPLTKMEILNQLPNLAANPVTVVKINRGFIPHSIKPQKNIYYFKKSSWVKNQNNNDSSSSAVASFNNNSPRAASSNSNLRTNQSQQNCDVVMQYNRQSFFNRNTFFQHNFSQYNQTHTFNYLSTFNYGAYFRYMKEFMRSVHMSIRLRNPFQGTVQQNVHFSYQQNTQHSYYSTRSNYNCRTQINFNKPEYQRSFRRSSDVVDITKNDEANVPSFNKLPNAASWSELKEKWLEEKIITIDDEEASDVDGEVQVLKQSIKPLLKVSGPMNFEEIYEKLRIIKSTPDVSVRKKSSDYTLSYNVYLSNQPYKKADPGVPVYRILVIRAQNSPHMNLRKLGRLQQEMKEVPIIIAHVSNTITYIQPGFVSLQNWY